MSVRQTPILTESDFITACGEAFERGETVFVQYKDVNPNTYEPEVVLAENFVWYLSSPNDFWYEFETGKVRAWKNFPNREERDLPWEKS